ncbi:hypothetical protein Baya_14968 [Bagarius yarrelli]|uniref:Uncharacterized protein n=1 Tax=Bagarius yarrelli TaxID=175774 RepID=A0A556VAQ5_BAGYA|nr:hypothetical protein Baya_14968 [Bagarius yarrelli]
MSSADVESLHPVPRQRGRCLDAFLLGSVLTLFIMALSGAALAVWTVKDLRAEMESKAGSHASVASYRTNEFPPNMDSSYKLKNFAYLTAISADGEIKNGNMLWKPLKYGNSSTVGSSYSYDSVNAVLTMNQEGAYFLYTQLNLTCVNVCSEGTLTVTFEVDRNVVLSCSLHLSSMTFHPAVEKCWTVIPQLSKGSRLLARIHLTMSPKKWRLDLNHSGFGMFLVD